jgi:hypothetical protein
MFMVASSPFGKKERVLASVCMDKEVGDVVAITMELNLATLLSSILLFFSCFF